MLRTIARMTRTIGLWIAYEGTDFHGWQRQGGLRTVQGVIEESLRRVVRHPVDLVASGRTDAGVHASGQVAGFVTSNDLPPDKLAHAIGSRLPDDVAIVCARQVHPSFHATQSAISKLYRYRIHNARAKPVTGRAQRTTYHFWRRLDVERMREGAARFVGEMDFRAMSGSGMVRQTTIRTVLRCEVERHLEEVRIDVEGSGFLYKQVRNMVGTLIAVGVGRWEPGAVTRILESRDRGFAGQTAPARGLCLQWVRYPGRLMTAAEDERCCGSENTVVSGPDSGNRA